MNPKDVEKSMEPFRKRRIAHRIASDARDELLLKLLSGGNERIIALVGPTAVGKSTVLIRVMEKLLEHHSPEIDADPGFIPYIAISAVTGLDGNFSWRDGFARLLDAGQEPLIGNKVKSKKISLQLDGRDISSTRHLLKDDFRRAFESMVRNRRIQYVFIDEASAIVDSAVNRNLVRQFNIVKSLCISLGISIIISGAYDLLDFKDGNGQLVRRTETIHMRRYVMDVSPLMEGETATERDYDDDGHFLTGLDHFSRALNMFIPSLPIPVNDDVFNDVQYYFMKCVGCIGNLHEWLDRACTRALTHKEGSLTQNSIEFTAFSNRTVQKLLTEAKIGEEDLKDIPDCEISKMYETELLNTANSQNSNKDERRMKPKRRIGQRGPSRDVTGALIGR